MNEIIYEKIADALVSKGYIVVEDVLGEELSSALFQYAKEQKAFKQAGISATASKHIDKKKRGDKILWLDEDDSVQSAYLAFMADLQQYLNRSLFMGLSYYESHFAIYDEGDFYEKHVDVFKNAKTRLVTTVYYLNSMTDAGGELVIYDEKNNLVEKVEPKADKLVVFLSDKFPHEVLRTKQKRYSIAGWFRVD